MGLPTACAVLLTLSAAAPQRGPATLRRAIALFNSFDDEAAETVFKRVLAKKPSREIEARAHLYLGLIAVNRLQIEQSLAEFRAALIANPTIDLIPDASPKARVAFAEARRDLMNGAAPPPAPPPPPVVAPAPPPAPAAATTETIVVESTPPHHSHALGITLLAIGVACAATATYGGVDFLQYNSQLNTASLHPGTVPYSSSWGQAPFWGVAWIPFAVAGAAGVTTGVLTW